MPDPFFHSHSFFHSQGKDRVNIAKWTMEDPSGGYIFEFAHGDYNASTDLYTPKNMPGDNYPLVIT